MPHSVCPQHKVGPTGPDIWGRWTLSWPLSKDQPCPAVLDMPPASLCPPPLCEQLVTDSNRNPLALAPQETPGAFCEHSRFLKLQLFPEVPPSWTGTALQLCLLLPSPHPFGLSVFLAGQVQKLEAEKQLEVLVPWEEGAGEWLGGQEVRTQGTRGSRGGGL